MPELFVIFTVMKHNRKEEIVIAAAKLFKEKGIKVYPDKAPKKGDK